MRFPLPKKHRHWIALGVAAPTLTVLFLVSGSFPWSPLNCWHNDVDINTGRIRRTRLLLYCKIGDRTEDTWLSRSLNDRETSPDWRRANTFSPGIGHSPHYRFHGAICQIKTLEHADNTIQFDAGARSKVAHALLRLWQNKGAHFDADKYVDKVAQTALAIHDKGASLVRASDVPDR